MASEILERFTSDAGLFPHHLDIASDQILLTHLSEQEYRNASFLDQRIITSTLQRETTHWNEFSDFDGKGLLQPYYIFHIGHVGSTLISRLLGELDYVLALREPAILRQLSNIKLHQVHSDWSSEKLEERLSEAVGWLSRTFRSGQQVNIKASSFVSPLATSLLQPSGKALFLYTSLELYLQTILAGEASLQEAQHLATPRFARMNTHLGESITSLESLTIVQKVALGWMCEMVTLDQACRLLPEANILWLDFDFFLEEPAKRLTEMATHFGYSIDSDKADRLISGPIMNSYSKAPEFDYSPDLRHQLLAQAAQEHAHQIEEMVIWVAELAIKFPKIADAIARSKKRV